jgi:endogenous inhibitor of DNA gyrase (YacG/DUF329 family)
VEHFSPKLRLLFWADSVPLLSALRANSAHADRVDDGTAKGDNVPEQLTVKCPSCGQTLTAADESKLVDSLQQHLHEKHTVEMPPERVRENVAAQLRTFDGYNARPISGA